MSHRALKKLNQRVDELGDLEVEDELLSLSSKNKKNKKNKNKNKNVFESLVEEEVEEEEEQEENDAEEEVGLVSGKQNLFSMLDLEGEDNDEAQDKEEEEDEKIKVEVDEEVVSIVKPIKKGGKTKRGKGKKNKKSNKPIPNKPEPVEGSDSDLEEILREMNQKFDDLGLNETNSLETKLKLVLQVELKHLDYFTEAYQKFGKSIVTQQLEKSPYVKFSGRPTLVKPKRTWPYFSQTVTMEKVGSQHNQFQFKYTPKYLALQQLFYKGVASNSQEILARVLQQDHYHVDTLLQVSYMLKVGGRVQEAGEFLERALYVFERSFPQEFSLVKGDCRVDYGVQDNRSFFLTLFKYIQFLSRQGYWRTSLEFSKLLFSLDPVEDPLAGVLLFDLFALKSKSYQFLVDLNQILMERTGHLPSFCYGVTLAKFYLWKGSKTPDQSIWDKIVLDLVHAILKFPNVMLDVLDKASLTVDTDLTPLKEWNEKLLAKVVDEEGVNLKVLSRLYVQRSHSLFKDPQVLSFLQSALRQATTFLRDENSFLVENIIPLWESTSLAKVDLSLARHIVLDEYTDLKYLLPPSLKSQTTYFHDPFPPSQTPDQIARSTLPSVYTIQSTQSQGLVNSNTVNILREFLRAEGELEPSAERLYQLVQEAQVHIERNNQENGQPDDASTDSENIYQDSSTPSEPQNSDNFDLLLSRLQAQGEEGLDAERLQEILDEGFASMNGYGTVPQPESVPVEGSEADLVNTTPFDPNTFNSILSHAQTQAQAEAQGRTDRHYYRFDDLVVESSASEDQSDHLSDEEDPVRESF